MHADTRDIAVIGGGAAGLMAALFAARSGASTVLLEGSRAPGLKILISGGGRCNVLPSETGPDDFHTSGSRKTMEKIFRTWPLARVTAFFEEELGVRLVIEKETGKVFPRSQKAREVRDALVQAVTDGGGAILCPFRVDGLERAGEGFSLRSSDGQELLARRVILAAGGQSVPKTGSDGHGYSLAGAFGHSVLPTYPALVPLTSPDGALKDLAGISLPVRWRARTGGKIHEERVRELLFTHRGFSGPAILDASHWVVRDGARIEVAWNGLDRTEWQERLSKGGRREVLSVVAEILPRRLAQTLVDRVPGAAEVQLAQLDRSRRERLLDMLCGFELPILGDEGFRVAEVTGGGVPLDEVDSRSLESRKAPGLFLCGEILDVIGRIGGYNFLWAWVTGKLAGEWVNPLR